MHYGQIRSSTGGGVLAWVLMMFLGFSPAAFEEIFFPPAAADRGPSGIFLQLVLLPSAVSAEQTSVGIWYRATITDYVLLLLG